MPSDAHRRDYVRHTVTHPPPEALDLWRLVFGDLRPPKGGRFLMTLFSGARREGRLTKVRNAWFAWDNHASLALRVAKAESDLGRDVYFCAHLFTASVWKREFVVPIICLWADVDHGNLTAGGLPEPSAVVETSPGRFQAYWSLAWPVDPLTGEWLNQRLALALGADPSGADLTRLLRVPGTRNWKYPEGPVVRVLHINRHARLNPDELDRVLPRPRGKERSPIFYLATVAPKYTSRPAEYKRIVAKLRVKNNEPPRPQRRRHPSGSRLPLLDDFPCQEGQS